MAATAGGRVAVWRYGGEGTWHLVKMVTRALQLAICTSPIIYLVCPVKFCISIVFYFSWEHYNTQEKSITKVMQRFGWQTRCIIGDVQMVNMAIRRDRKDCSKLSLKVRTCIVAQQCCVRLDGAKSLTGIKLCTTTSNNTQQGVHADATCNIQHCWGCWSTMLRPFVRSLRRTPLGH